MTKPDKGYKKFIETYITLTAPYLKLKYNKDDGILYYFYYSSKLNAMRLVQITDNWEEILYFFDLGWLVDPMLNDMKKADFVNAILYSTFYNSNVITMSALYAAKVDKNLVKTFCIQRLEDPNKTASSNYLFVDNHNLTIAMVQEMFPKCGLRAEIDELIKKNSTSRNDKKLSYVNVKKWCPELKDTQLEKIQGMLEAYGAFVKNSYKKSVKEYTKDNDLDTIIKNFRNYIYDINLIV